MNLTDFHFYLSIMFFSYKGSGVPVEIMKKRRMLLWIDVAVKLIGFVITITVYPPVMMYSVIIAAALLMIGIRAMKLDWDHMK